MTEKELKSLRRADLLEMLIESEKLRAEEAAKQEETIEALRKEILDLTEQLNEKHIAIRENGTLADACVRLNGLMDSAQNAADQYLENINYRYRSTDAECEEKLSAAREECRLLYEETQEKCRLLEEKTKALSFDLLRQTRQECRELEELCEGKRQETEFLCEEMLRKAKLESEQIKSEGRFYADRYFAEKNNKLDEALKAYDAVKGSIRR